MSIKISGESIPNLPWQKRPEGCNGYFGPTIGIARTKDFEHYEQLENAFLPFNRNGVLFPRKINGH